jgi:hypothetical protein
MHLCVNAGKAMTSRFLLLLTLAVLAGCASTAGAAYPPGVVNGVPVDPTYPGPGVRAGVGVGSWGGGVGFGMGW